MAAGCWEELRSSGSLTSSCSSLLSCFQSSVLDFNYCLSQKENGIKLSCCSLPQPPRSSFFVNKAILQLLLKSQLYLCYHDINIVHSSARDYKYALLLFCLLDNRMPFYKAPNHLLTLKN